MRQDVALRHFSYTADKAIFTPPSNAVAVAGVYDLMVKMPSDDSMTAYARTQIQPSPLDAVAYWQQIKGTPEQKKKSVQELYKEMVGAQTFDQAIDLFADAMVNEVKARKEREEKEEKKTTRGANPPDYDLDGDTVVFDDLFNAQGFSIDGVTAFTIGGSQGKPRSIQRSDDGSIKLGYTTGDSKAGLTFIELNDKNIEQLEGRIPGIKAKYSELSRISKSNDEVPTKEQIDRLVKNYPRLERFIRGEGLTKGEIIEAFPESQKALLRRVLQMDGESTGGFSWVTAN
jgi:hypothetical protein